MHLKKGKKIMIIVLCIVLSAIALIAGRIVFLTSATTGKTIANYGKDNAALLVIDVQEDTLSFPQYGNTGELIHNINTATKYAEEQGIDIIYIRQEYSNPLDLLLFGGKYKENSKGASLSSQLQVRSDHIFHKERSDSFSQKTFENYLIDKGINTLYIVGADASACVYKTSLGGVNRGYHVTILSDCIFSMNDTILGKMIKKYKEAGIDVENIKDFQSPSIAFVNK